MNENEFLIELQAKLDEAKSKDNVNTDIDAIKKKIKELQLQAKIDQTSIDKIVKQVESIFGKEITISNIKIDSSSIEKQTQNTSQNISNAIKKTIQSVKNDISNTIKDIPRLDANKIIGDMNLNRSSVETGIVSQVKLLVSEINNLGRDIIKVGNDDSWEKLLNKSNELGKILKNFGKTKNLSALEDVKKLAEYLNGKTLSVGYKSSGLSGTDYNIKQLNKELNDLGVKFSATKQNATELNSIWEEMCTVTGRADLLNITNAHDQIQTIIQELLRAQSIINGEAGLINHPNSRIVLDEYINNIEKLRNTVVNLEKELATIMQKESETSSSTANTVIQNEERKQAAIRETTREINSFASNESLIKNGASSITFDETNNAAKKAQEYFKSILQNENAIISTVEKFDENNSLTSFIVNVKRATGEVESLKYVLKTLTDEEGNIQDTFFGLSESSIGDAGAKKLLQNIENSFADYTAKIAQFKNTNKEILSGLDAPLNDFENKLVGLKSGVYTIDDVRNSYKLLNTEASNITSNFTGQLNKIDAAIRNISKGEETISGLKAEFKGLNSVPKDINSELNKLSTSLQNINKIESQEGRIANWANAYREWEKAVDNLKAKLSALKKEQSNIASSEVFKTSDLRDNNIAYMTKVSNTIEKQMAEIQKMANAKGWKDFKVQGFEETDGKIKQLTLTVTEAEGALKKLNFQRAKLQGNGKAHYGLMQTGDVQVLKTASQAQDELAEKTKKANNELEKQINKIQGLSNGTIKNDYSTQIAKLEGNFRNLGFTQDETKNKIQNVTNAFEVLKTRINQPFDESNYQEIILLNDKLQKELAESTNEYAQLSASEKGYASVQQRLSKANIIEAWNQKNSGATKEIISNNQAYIDSLRNLNVQMSKMDFDEISDGFKKNENAMRALGKLGITFKEQMSQAAQSFTQWLSISSGVMLLISRTKNAISELKEVNTLLTEISKANDKLSKTDLIKIGNDSFDVASKYGKTATDYLAGVQEASRAGYENAMGIAELSVAAQGAGDMTAELANQYIIATDKAYKLGGSVEQLTEVLEGSNYITNHNAVNMTELAEGMSIVGSQAASLGVKVNETTAVLGTMIATTQQSGSEMARAFKAILLNLQQVTDEEEGIDAEGLTKYEEACKALNVSLKETKNGVISLRDPMEVIKDLAAEYSKLDSNDIRRTNLLSSVGGKLRANALNAILENYDMYSKMLDEYAMGTGSMAAEAEKTANSWEGSLNRLSNTWTDTIENIANSDAIITSINSLNSLLAVVNNITDKLGSLGTIGLGTGIFSSIKNAGRVKCNLSYRICLL